MADEPLGAPGVYANDRVFVHLRNEESPDASRDAAIEALAAAGHPTVTAGMEGPRRPRQPVLLRRVRHRGGRLGARDQPVRPAQRAGGEGQHRTRARRLRQGGTAAGAPRTPRTTRCERCSTGSSPRRYLAMHGLRRALGRVRRRGRGAARGRSATRSRLPPRSATARASCTPPASSTRAARRPGVFLQLIHDGDRGRRGPGGRLQLHHAQERAGDRRPGHAASPRPARRARARSRAISVAALRALTQKVKEML